MGYVLIWIELLAVGLLTTAVLLAAGSRLSARWPARLLAAVLTLAVLGVVVWLIVERHSVIQFYDYLTSLWIFMLLGVIAVIVLGLRRLPTGEPAARDWSIGRLALAWCLVVGLHMMTMANMDTSVRSALAAMTSEAGTVALNVAPVRVPDHENAALVYLKAFDTLTEPAIFAEIEDESDNFDKNLAAKINSVRDALAARQATLALLRRGAAMQNCRFDRDYSRPSISMLLPEIQLLRNASRHLRYDARLKLLDGDRQGAVEDVAAMFGIARHVGADSLLITALIAIAIHSDACQTLQAALDAGELSTQQLDILKIDETLSFRLLLTRGLLMEEAFGLSTFATMPEELVDLIPEYPSGRLFSFSPVSAYVRVFLIAGEVNHYRTAMARFRNASQKPYYQGGRELEEISEWPGLFVNLLLPAFGRASQATVRGDAEHSLALAAVAAAKYRAANDRLPENVDELAPKFVSVPLVDPYDGKPIRLVKNGDELKLYSIGPDGKDDHGAAFDEEQKTGDLSFHLRHAETQTAENRP